MNRKAGESGVVAGKDSLHLERVGGWYMNKTCYFWGTEKEENGKTALVFM